MTTTKKFVDKIYKLTKDAAPLAYMLPTRNTKRFPILHFNEETGVNRPLRYAKNQKTIFEDEQDDNVLLEPIIFEDGFLTVKRTNPLLQDFLALHPLNGKQFVEVNKEKDAKEQVEILAKEVDALIEARQLTTEQAETIGRILFGDKIVKMTTAEVKRDLLVFARNEPSEFLEVISDPLLKLQARVQEFLDKHLIVFKGKKQRDIHFNTKSNKERFLVVPYGENPLYIIASYFKSDEGIESLKYLEKLIKKEK